MTVESALTGSARLAWENAALGGLESGAVVAGYRIDSLVGRGGMGVVYRALDMALDRHIALKLIAPQIADDPMYRQRFQRECRLAASIRHPHVITIYRAGEENGLLFLAMDYIQGSDLGALIQGDGRLGAAEVVDVVSQVASALDAAHALSLIHRDVKPANVVVARHGAKLHAYLTDFGLTKRLTANTVMTATGVLVGTVGYLAPEQVKGEPLDARTDVYSLGCVLFHSLTGRLPYPRENDAQVMFAHASEPPPSICELDPTLPSALDGVVRRAMAKMPEERFPTAGELASASWAALEMAQETARRVRPAPAQQGAIEATSPSSHQPGTQSAPPTGAAVQPHAPADVPGSAAVPRLLRRRRLLLLAGLPLLAVAVVVAVVVVATSSRPPVGRVVEASIPVSKADGEVVAGKQGVWATSLSGRVYRIDPRTNKISATVRIPYSAPGAIAEGEGAVWVDSKCDAITRIDPRTSKFRNIRVPETCKGRSIAVGEGVVWVANKTDGRLTRLSARSMKPIGEPVALGKHIEGIAVGNNGTAYATREDGTVLVLDADTGQQYDKFDAGGYASDPEFLPGSLWMYIADTKLARFDTSSLTRTSLIRLNKSVQIAMPHGQDVWAGDLVHRTILRLNADTGRLVGKPIHLSASPVSITIGDSGVWVLTSDQRVTRINPDVTPR